MEHDSQSLAANQPTRRPSSANPTASTLRPPNISDNIVSMVSNQFAAVPEVNILFFTYITIEILQMSSFFAVRRLVNSLVLGARGFLREATHDK